MGAPPAPPPPLPARPWQVPLAAAGLLLAAAVPAAAGPADLTAPIVSGLAWRSGAKVGDCLAGLRGRALDVNHIFMSHLSFAKSVKLSGAWARSQAPKAPLLLVSLPLLTDDTKGRFAQCAAGAYDASFRQIGANLAAAGAQGTVVRLGWEANIGSDVHPWGVDGPAQYPAYKACWRRAALAIKAGGPSIRLDWTSAKKGGQSIAGMYPGDDVVDIIGAHYYDTGPAKSTQALWDDYYARTYNGGPWGIGAWLAFARAHGKRLSVGEWGVWQRDAPAKVADDPVYVDGMYRFFRDHAPDIAYESYHNSIAVHALCSGTRFPKAAARYKALWAAGR